MKKLVIKLKKTGLVKQPSYSIVVCSNQVHCKIIEKLGYYNPTSSGVNFCINFQRLGFWLNKGITIKDSVKTIIQNYAKIY